MEDDGLFGAPVVSVFVSDGVHASVLKSLALLGLQRNRVHKLATDEQGRIRDGVAASTSSKLHRLHSGGDVNSGALDDAAKLNTWAHEAGAWVHVDRAFSLWGLPLPSLNSSTSEFTQADSWATDAHKWLSAPYDCGVGLVRDADALRSAMSMQAAYLEQSTQRRDPSHLGPELSRRARGVEV